MRYGFKRASVLCNLNCVSLDSRKHSIEYVNVISHTESSYIKADLYIPERYLGTFDSLGIINRPNLPPSVAPYLAPALRLQVPKIIFCRS